MKPFSVIFCGTPEFAVPSLCALVENDSFSVDLVITQPDKPVGRTQKLTPPPVKVAAEKLGIPVIQPEDINAALVKSQAPNTKHQILHFKPDFLVVVAYGQLLSKEILSLARIAPVNVHASLLPLWRGASPIQNALLAGDWETGVTIQQIVRALDAGPILAQEKIPIEKRATFPLLYQRLALLGAELLIETLSRPLVPKEQNDDAATFCRKLTRADGNADPDSMVAEYIDRKVRALVPWPGVTCELGGMTVKLLKTSLEGSRDALPVPCAQNTTLYIEELQPPGKKPMTGAAWARGQKK